MTNQNYYEEIFKRYGAVTRAKGYHLYTKSGVRLTDLFQENGRAILGWTAGNAYTHLKNNLSRGITGSFITEEKPRINKAISQLLFSQRQVYFFNSKNDALQASLSLSPENTSIYRPWACENTNWPEIDCAIITPPLPWTDTIYILAVKEELLSNLKLLPESFSKAIKPAFPLEAAITRSIYNLIQAINVQEEKDWFIYDSVITKYWERKGRYLYPKMPLEKYDAFVLHCMDMQLCISPHYNSPSLIPYGVDKGNFSKLKNSPFEY